MKISEAVVFSNANMMAINGATIKQRQEFKEQDEDISWAPYGSIVNQEAYWKAHFDQQQQEEEKKMLEQA